MFKKLPNIFIDFYMKETVVKTTLKHLAYFRKNVVLWYLIAKWQALLLSAVPRNDEILEYILLFASIFLSEELATCFLN
jgi:hypothetical protein